MFCTIDTSYLPTIYIEYNIHTFKTNRIIQNYTIVELDHVKKLL